MSLSSAALLGALVSLRWLSLECAHSDMLGGLTLPGWKYPVATASPTPTGREGEGAHNL